MSNYNSGLSCDHICNHGVYVSRERCMLCELQKQINALTEMYKHISSMVAGCEDHRIRQIDENRKISRRVDELEIFVRDHEHYLKKIDKISLCDPDKVRANLKELMNRIEKLENIIKEKVLHEDTQSFKVFI
jgi:predicted transcriptional regulator with HTH domain